MATSDCDFACHHRTLGEKMFMQPVVKFQNTTQTSVTTAMVRPLCIFVYVIIRV